MGTFFIIKIALRISDSNTDIIRATKVGFRLAHLSADTPFTRSIACEALGNTILLASAPLS